MHHAVFRFFSSSEHIEEWLQSQREEKRRLERESKAQRERDRNAHGTGGGDVLFENAADSDDTSLDSDGLPKKRHPANGGPSASTEDVEDSTDSSLYSSDDSDAEGDDGLDADDDDDEV